MYDVRRFYPMPIADAGLVKARHVFTKHKGMLRTSDAIPLGVHPRTLYNLRDRGELEQVGRGIYRLSTAPPLTSPDLVSVAIRIPRAVNLPNLCPGTSRPHDTGPACGGRCAAQPRSSPQARWHSTTCILVLQSVIQRRDRRHFDRPGSRAGVFAGEDDRGLLQVPKQDRARRRHRSPPNLP